MEISVALVSFIYYIILHFRFNFFAMQLASPVLGPFFFFCYTISVAYVLINMFLTILNESFATVRGDMYRMENDYEMVDFVIKKFKVRAYSH